MGLEGDVEVAVANWQVVQRGNRLGCTHGVGKVDKAHPTARTILIGENLRRGA